MNILINWMLAFLINSTLIISFHRLPLLTPSGWIHAGCLGTILWACLGVKGWSAVLIYLALGSLVTRIGYKYKNKIGIAQSRGGKRGPENVWGSAATGTFLAILINTPLGFYKPILMVGFAASFAAKLADTFGSEIGQRYGKKAYLITSLKSVSIGTDGAISIEGTFASAIGSIVMSFAMLFLGIITSVKSFILVSIVGFIATLMESILGAIIQSKTKLLTNEIINFIQTFLSALIAIIIAIKIELFIY